jgi:hypothetical protein
MGFIGDFLAGRTYRLARDFLFAGVAIVVMCVGALTVFTSMLEQMRVAGRQTLPPRIANQGGPVTTQEIVRSVLDDNPTTASIGTRSILTEPQQTGPRR